MFFSNLLSFEVANFEEEKMKLADHLNPIWQDRPWQGPADQIMAASGLLHLRQVGVGGMDFCRDTSKWQTVNV